MEIASTSNSNPSYWWVRVSFFWIAVAALFGIWKALPLAGVLFNDYEMLSQPFGKLFQVAKGVFVYGWGIPLLIGICLSSFPQVDRVHRHWHIFMWILWQVSIVLGIGSILCGNGTGISPMPFDWWVLVPLMMVLAGYLVLFAGWGYNRDDNLSGFSMTVIVAAFAVLLTSFLLLFANRGVGVVGVMLVASLKSVLSLGAFVICLAANLKYDGERNRTLRKVAYILLFLVAAVFIPLSGVSTVITWPVPWDFVYWGMVSSANAMCILIGVCLIAIYCSYSKSRFETSVTNQVAFRNVGLTVMLVWLVWKFVNPMTSYGTPEGQFLIVQWYAVDFFMLVGVGLVGFPVYTSRMKGYQPWPTCLWVTACLSFLAVCGLALHGGYLVKNEKNPQLAEQATTVWVGVVSAAEIIAWLLLGVAGAVITVKLSKERSDEEYVQSVQPSLKAWVPVVALVTVALSFGTLAYQGFLLNTKAQAVIPFESPRPGVEAEGSRIYVAEGCGVCHTQVVRRLRNGRDLREAVNFSVIGGGAARYAEPQDYNLEMGEGAAHVGMTRVGPDFFNLASRVEQYVMYRDSDGELRQTATPDEWLYLHLYNPREPQLKKTWSICSSMPHLFTKQPVSAMGRSPFALPVECEEGYEVVPTPRAMKLIAYLKTLKRVAVPDEIEPSQYYLNRPWSHITPVFAGNTPEIDYSPLARRQIETEMERGRQIFLAKCAICHGRDGMGDQVNYPPLLDSEWLAEKEYAEIAGIMRNGLTGPITVKGREWDSTMLPPGITGSKELAPLMTYILKAFGKRDITPLSREEAEKLWIEAGNAADQ